VEDWSFDYPLAASCLLDHYQTASLEGFGLGDKPLAVRAAGALLSFLKKIDMSLLSLSSG